MAKESFQKEFYTEQRFFYNALRYILMIITYIIFEPDIISNAQHYMILKQYPEIYVPL